MDPEVTAAPGPRPSLLILDLKLPRKSGILLLQALKRDPSPGSIPVIVYSSSRQKRDVDAVYALGADFYLVKSVDRSRILEDARGIHGFWRSGSADPEEPGVDPTLSGLRRLSEPAASVR